MTRITNVKNAAFYSCRRVAYQYMHNLAKYLHVYTCKYITPHDHDPISAHASRACVCVAVVQALASSRPAPATTRRTSTSRWTCCAPWRCRGSSSSVKWVNCSRVPPPPAGACSRACVRASIAAVSASDHAINRSACA